MPHTFEYYAGRPADYYLQTRIGKQVFYSSEPGEEKYLDKYVYGVEDHFEYLQLIGIERLMQLNEMETIREGYHP